MWLEGEISCFRHLRTTQNSDQYRPSRNEVDHNFDYGMQIKTEPVPEKEYLHRKVDLRLSCSMMRILSWSRTVLRMRSPPDDMFRSSLMV